MSTDRKIHGNSQENYFKADECMRHVRVLNGTGILILDNLRSIYIFTVIDRSTQYHLEEIQGKLQVRRLTLSLTIFRCILLNL